MAKQSPPRAATSTPTTSLIEVTGNSPGLHRSLHAKAVFLCNRHFSHTARMKEHSFSIAVLKEGGERD